jgi:hypothetical protein
MNVQIQFKQTTFSDSEVEATVAYALKREMEQARLRRDHFAEQCQQFEESYEMDSDTFLQKFEQGELGDEADYFDWYAAKRGFDLWEKRYRILRELVG